MIRSASICGYVCEPPAGTPVGSPAASGAPARLRPAVRSSRGAVARPAADGAGAVLVAGAHPQSAVHLPGGPWCVRTGGLGDLDVHVLEGVLDHGLFPREVVPQLVAELADVGLTGGFGGARVSRHGFLPLKVTIIKWGGNSLPHVGNSGEA